MSVAVSALVAEILAGGGFDASNTTVLAWLDRRHKEMVNFAKAYRDLITIGTTSAGTSEYVVPAGFVELEEITVGGITYTRSLHTDIAALDNGFLWLSGPGGLAIQSANASSQTTIILRPIPSAAGQAIIGYGAAAPPDLLLNDTVPILVDDDSIEALKAGVYAIGLGAPAQGQADEAAAQLATFTEGKQDFRRRTKRRLRGSGPTQIRVAGLNA